MKVVNGRVAGFAGLLLASLVMGGCGNDVKVAYDRAAIGTEARGDGPAKPQTLQMPCEIRQCAAGGAYAVPGKSKVPAEICIRRMAYLLDGSRVAGRLYQGHWERLGLLSAGATETCVAEVEVPREWFLEPDDYWDPNQEIGGATHLRAQVREMTTPGKASSTRPAADSSEKALPYVLEHMRRRGAEDVSEPNVPRNAARYIQACILVMEGMRDNADYPIEFSLAEVLCHPRMMRGITSEFFDREWRHNCPAHGIYRHYRVRAIGPGRFRIESTQRGVFFLTSFYGYWGTAVNVLGKYSGTTKIDWKNGCPGCSTCGCAVLK
jgi:hypothetical protein